MKNKALASLLLLSTQSFGMDLATFQSAQEQISGVDYPRTTDRVSLIKGDSKYELRSKLKDLFFTNKNSVFTSELGIAIADKIQNKRVDDKIYKFMYESGITQLIKDFKTTGDTQADSEAILELYLAGLNPSEIEDEILQVKGKHSRYLLNEVESNPFQNKKDDYIAFNFSDIKTNLFDYGFYKYKKNMQKNISNEFLSLNSIEVAGLESFERRYKNGDLRYSILFDEYQGEKYGYILSGLMSNGKRANCITKLSDLKYSFCDYSTQKIINEEPKIIGILSKCSTGNNCVAPTSLWASFSGFSDEKISSRDLSEIEEVDDKKNYLAIDLPLIKISGGDFPAHVASGNPAFSELNMIAQKDADYQAMKVKKIYENFSYNSPLSVTYSFDDKFCKKAAKAGEECLDINEAIYMKIPDELQNIPVENITIAHRQNTNDNRGVDSFDSRTGAKVKDVYPGFAAVQVYDDSFSYKNAWRYWGGHVSGINGGKYSEHKKDGDWEFDNLYEWPLYGHRASHQNQKESSKSLYGKYIRVFADIGKFSEIRDYDKAYIHSVTIEFVQEKSDEYKEWSFTNDKTDLGDPLTMKGRSYGGGPSYNGLYPGAIIINPKRWVGKTQSKDWNGNWSGGELEHELEVGKVLKSIEIAAGDTHPDQRPNKDGGIGSAGGANLTVLLKTKNGEEVLIDKANLGPRGVVKGIPTDLKYRIQDGDKLIVEINGDYAYIMGARVGYDK